MKTAAELEVGYVVGGYRIEELLGRGGMGVVYRARQLALDRIVALKLVAPELAHDTSFRERFLREARFAASLDHPHVLPVHEVGEADGLLFVSMRFVDGRDVGKVLAADGALPPERAVELLSHVTSALDAAHARGLVHRDVKPSNVLIENRDGLEHAFLCDFGLAKAAAQGSQLTLTGEFLGTVDYASPEQIRGDAVGPPGDVYAAGCLLYYSLTGRVPFPQSDPLAKLWAHLHHEPEPPSAVRPELPGRLDDVLAKALSKAPAERYASAGELGRAATTAVSSGGRGRRRSRLVLRPPVKRRLAVLVLALVVAAGATFIAVATQLRDESPAQEDAGASGQAAGWHVDGTPIEVDSMPTDLTVDEDVVSVAMPEAAQLARIEASTGEVLAQSAFVDTANTALASGRGYTWVVNQQGSLRRVDSSSGAVAARRTLVPGAIDVAYGFDSVWVLQWSPGRVSRVDPDTQRVVAVVSGLGSQLDAIAAGAGAVWVLTGKGLVRIDPTTNELQGTPIRVGADAQAVVAASSVWVARELDDTVVEVDPARGEVVGNPVRVGHAPWALAMNEAGLWVVNKNDGTLSLVDLETRSTVDAPIAVGPQPSSVAADDDSIWIGNEQGSTVRRITRSS